MHDRTAFHLLLTPAFLCALLLLLLNDHVLKPAFGGVVTGKLSDFAGLFAFTTFWIALFPRRRTIISIAIILSFILWKLPLSDELVALWNRTELLTIGRVTDHTDLLALLMIPIALHWSRRVTAPSRVGFTTVMPLLLISAFAFIATSSYGQYHYNEYDDRYPLMGTLDSAVSILRALDEEDDSVEITTIRHHQHSYRIIVDLVTRNDSVFGEGREVEVTYRLTHFNNQSHLDLSEINGDTHPCGIDTNFRECYALRREWLRGESTRMVSDRLRGRLFLSTPTEEIK